MPWISAHNISNPKDAYIKFPMVRTAGGLAAGELDAVLDV
jgi:hypothetical protein